MAISERAAVGIKIGAWNWDWESNRFVSFLQRLKKKRGEATGFLNAALSQVPTRE
jgi:hypothetical protein